MKTSNREEWPLVTVFTLVFNTGKYVVETLDSVRSNNYPNIQHIIIDDCSSDRESVPFIEKWIKDNNYSCTFIKHQRNMGICKSINEVLQLTEGKYIFGVCDDLILPEKVQRQVELLENALPEYGVVYSDAYLINGNGTPRSGTFIRMHRKFADIPEGYIFDTLLEGNFIPAMATLVKTECYEKVGIYDETLGYEDFDMWLRIAKEYKFMFSDYISAKYRINENGLHLTKKDWGIDDYRIYSKHVQYGPVVMKKLELAAANIYRVRDHDNLNLILDDFEKTYGSKPILYYFIKLRIPYILYRIFHEILHVVKRK
jgi:glycosyltransferase involved in cell wall biosynthesis